ncbi:unnamed protein product [Calypogeia fissa]
MQNVPQNPSLVKGEWCEAKEERRRSTVNDLQMYAGLNFTSRATIDGVVKQLGMNPVDETMLVLLKHITQAESRVTLAEEKVIQYKRWEEELDEDDTEIIQKLCTYEDNIAWEQVTLMDLLKLIGVTDYIPGEDLSQGWAMVKEKVSAILAVQENKDEEGIEILGSTKAGQTDKGDKEAKALLKEEFKCNRVTKIDEGGKCIHGVQIDLVAKSNSEARSSHEVASESTTKQQTKEVARVGTPAKTTQASAE